MKFNLKEFFRYLGSTILSVLLAPIITLVISCFAYLLKNDIPITQISFVTLYPVILDSLYGDVLFSILTICIIIIFSSEFTAQIQIRRYLGNVSVIYPWLRKACYVVTFLLFLLGIYYKAKLSGGVIQSNPIYNWVEAFGFCICVILQCISHPKAYFGP